jgi:myo-inositol-hexaphosphate 3-phosphohydrolase
MKDYKALSFIAALALMVSAAGCGDQNTSDSNDNNSSATTAEATTEKTTDASSDADVPEIEGYDLLWNDKKVIHKSKSDTIYLYDRFGRYVDSQSNGY